MPTVVCGKCNKPFSLKKGATIMICPNCGSKLTLREVRFVTEKEGEFYP